MNKNLLITFLIILFTRPAIVNAECFINPEINGFLTNLTGKKEGIISNRHQEHLWITDDGVFHVLINNGKRHNALQLLSSIDGIEWISQAQIFNTDRNAQSDGFLNSNTLWVIYPSLEDKLLLRKFYYNFNERRWFTENIFNIYYNPYHFPDKPTIALDQLGIIWIAFSDLDRLTGETVVKVISVEKNMVATHPIIFATQNQSQQKSARILQLKDKIVLIYTDNPDASNDIYTLNLAYRLNSYTLDAAWTSGGELFRYGSGENDPQGVHFNTAIDSLDNIHIVGRSDKKVIYLRIRDGQPMQADQARFITYDSSLPYVQVSVSSNNEVYILYPARCVDNKKAYIGVLRSQDLGQTFTRIATLNFDWSYDLGNPRVESPSQFKNILPILRQIETRSEYRLVFFKIDSLHLP